MLFPTSLCGVLTFYCLASGPPSSSSSFSSSSSSSSSLLITHHTYYYSSLTTLITHSPTLTHSPHSHSHPHTHTHIFALTTLTHTDTHTHTHTHTQTHTHTHKHTPTHTDTHRHTHTHTETERGRGGLRRARAESVWVGAERAVVGGVRAAAWYRGPSSRDLRDRGPAGRVGPQPAQVGAVALMEAVPGASSATAECLDRGCRAVWGLRPAQWACKGPCQGCQGRARVRTAALSGCVGGPRLAHHPCSVCRDKVRDWLKHDCVAASKLASSTPHARTRTHTHKGTHL